MSILIPKFIMKWKVGNAQNTKSKPVFCKDVKPTIWNIITGKYKKDKEYRKNEYDENPEKWGIPGDVIGRGSYGEVKVSKVIDKASGKVRRIYAQKQFLRYTLNDNDNTKVFNIKQIASEYRFAAALKHRNIVKTYAKFQDHENNWNLVMEYCPYGDLNSILYNEGIPISKANLYFEMLMDGVDYLHTTGIVHLDLKLANLLVGVDGQLKICDFSSAKWHHKPDDSIIRIQEGFIGTLPYMAPEIFIGSGYDGVKADIWSCGIIYYELAIGILPWEAAYHPDSIRWRDQLDKNYVNYYRNNILPYYLPSGAFHDLILIAMLQLKAEDRLSVRELKTLLVGDRTLGLDNIPY